MTLINTPHWRGIQKLALLQFMMLHCRSHTGYSCVNYNVPQFWELSLCGRGSVDFLNASTEVWSYMKGAPGLYRTCCTSSNREPTQRRLCRASAGHRVPAVKLLCHGFETGARPLHFWLPLSLHLFEVSRRIQADIMWWLFHLWPCGVTKGFHCCSRASSEAHRSGSPQHFAHTWSSEDP